MMTDVLATKVTEPGPWGERPLGTGEGLKPAPEPPKLEDMNAALEPRVKQVEADVRTLMIALAAGFVAVVGALAVSHLRLTDSVSNSEDRIVAKLDAMNSTLSDLKVDVAVIAATKDAPREGE